jgi:superfamily II DNA or RNA helicase
MEKLSPFDFVNSICQGAKSDIMLSSDEEKQYNAFIINRALSYHQDCILLVNEINCHPQLDKRLQYDFLRLTLRPRKRYSKWIKPKIEEKIRVIKEYYKYSNEKASAVESLISDEQIEEMKRKLNKGGRTK